MRARISRSVIMRLGLGLGAASALVAAPGAASAVTGTDTPTTSVPTLTAPTLTVPTLVVPTLPQVTMPSLPQLQIPQLSTPTLQAPTLQAPTLQAPEFPVLPTPTLPPLTLPSRPKTSAKAQRQTAAGAPTVQPNVVDPQVLLNTLQGPEEPTVELVAPQEAATGERLPTRTIVTIGGGIALIWFALSLLRRRNDEQLAAETTSTNT